MAKFCNDCWWFNIISRNLSKYLFFKKKWNYFENLWIFIGYLHTSAAAISSFTGLKLNYCLILLSISTLCLVPFEFNEVWINFSFYLFNKLIFEKNKIIVDWNWNVYVLLSYLYFMCFIYSNQKIKTWFIKVFCYKNNCSSIL